MLFVLATLLSTLSSAPPRTCTPVPARAWDWTVHSSGVGNDGERHERSVVHRRATQRFVDLDGDGALDWLVPIVTTQTACPEDVRWQVWLSDAAGCGRAVGTVGPGAIEADGDTIVATMTKVERGRDGVPERIEVTRRFARRGARWTQTGAHEQRGRCHHCSSWTCAGPAAVTIEEAR